MLEKLIDALFGRMPRPKKEHAEGPKPEGLPTERTVERYYQRTLRLRKEILNGTEIKENICAAFEYVYLGREKPSGLVYLGQGDTHILFNVGKVIDPQNSRPVDLAVRLWHYDNEPYDMGNLFLLIPQLYAFEESFVNGRNPPYFIGAVSWKRPKKSGYRLIGFILEDVSERRKYRLIPDRCTSEFFFRDEGDRRCTKFFLDPNIEYMGRDVASKYLSDEARIDVD